MRYPVFLLAVVVVGPLSFLSAAPPPMSSPAVVRQIDHVLFTSDHAPALFALLSETLQLPVVWPLSNYGGFGSGGVALGNVNLEVIKARTSSPEDASNRFVGLALEPEPLKTSLPEIEARRIAHGAPAPFRSWQATGSRGILWTTVALPEVSSDALEIFLCDYTHDEPARRRRFGAELQARRGGPLSLHSVREIVIAARDANRARANWQKLLQPAAVSEGAWPVGAGPALRVVEAAQDEIQEVIVAVASLDQARRFLRQHGLLDQDRPTQLRLATPRFPGFRLTLVESSPPPR